MNSVDLIVEKKGIALTPLRKQVFSHILSAQQPISAYHLLKQLQAIRGNTPAASIYRALDFLLKHQLIHKISSNHTFLACSHHCVSHIPYFFICEQCQHTEEIAYPSTPETILQISQHLRFEIHHYMIEIKGICHSCKTILHS